jgi:hypothetical protein
MLTLPVQGRRAFVQSFWWTLAAAWLGAATVAALILGVPLAIALAATVPTAALVALVPFTAGTFARRAYHAWNGRLARPLAIVIAAAVARIVYFVVFAAVGRSGPRRGVAASRWTPREPLKADAYQAPFAAAVRDPVSSGWVSAYVRWARTHGQLWSVALLPFLATLSLLPTDEVEPPQANIYTLF